MHSDKGTTPDKDTTPDKSTGSGRTAVGFRTADRLVIALGIPTLLSVVGFAVPPLARWALELPGGLPFGVVFAVLGSADRPWEVAVNGAIWFGIGVRLAWSAYTKDAKVLVSDEQVQVLGGGRPRTVDRAQVGAVFLDGSVLIVLDRRSRPQVRTRPQGRPKQLESAFLAHGYPWRGEDPYASNFRRWDPDVGASPPDLPAATAALLTLRQAQLDRGADQQARELRDAVEGLGVVLRDERKRQFWRPLIPED